MNNGNSIHQRIRFYAGEETKRLYQDFQISTEGYEESQVAGSREQYGSNTFSRRISDTVIYRLRRAFINPFTVILAVLAAISFVTDVLLASNYSRNMTTVLLILCMLLLSGILRFSQEMKAKRAADHLTGLLTCTVQVRRGGNWVRLPSSELVVGDTVRLSAGERVPADLRLIQEKHLYVSQAAITGESSILEKKAETCPVSEETSWEAYKNILFMGSAVMSGTAVGIVLAVGENTVYGGAPLAGFSRRDRFDEGANSIAWVLIRFMAVLVPVVFLLCGITRGNWLSAFLFALSVAVGLTPEMLPMVINACLTKGSISMSRKETVVKNINAMQAFGSMDVLCVDKTGTLTGDRILLEYYMDILGNESQRVLDFAYLNSLYQEGVPGHLDAAVLAYREIPEYRIRFSELAAQYRKLDDFPRDYEHNVSGVLTEKDGRKLLLVKGSLKEVCRRCRYVEYRGERREIEENGFASIHAVVDEMLEDGMKVLAVAYRPWTGNQTEVAEDDLVLLGYLAFFDAPKKTAAAAVEKLKALQVGIRVLTGDQKNVAISVCRRLGIDTGQILTGEELEALPKEQRSVRVEQTTVFAELSPRQKVSVVSALQKNGHTVGFLGDGMNDLPAIAEADVGISVDTAVEAVKESADVILLKNDLNVLEKGVLEGRKAFANMFKYIRITASSNFGNIFSIVIAGIFLPFFPITAIQLLLLNLLYDTLCLVLPWDHVDKKTYARPLEWSGRTLGRFMRFFGPISSFFDLLTFGFLFFILCPSVCGGEFAALAGTEMQKEFIRLFQTGWFLESMWTQVLILYLLRTEQSSLFQSRPSRPVILVTMFGILLFTVLTFTPVGSLIGLTALPPVYFGFLILNVSLYLLFVTLAKRWYLRKYRELR